MKRDAKQTAAQRETTYEILNHVDYQDASLVVMGMGKNGLILQDMETELYVENIVILPIQTDEGVRFNLHFVTSLEEVGLVDENSSTYQMED